MNIVRGIRRGIRRGIVRGIVRAIGRGIGRGIGRLVVMMNTCKIIMSSMLILRKPGVMKDRGLAVTFNTGESVIADVLGRVLSQKYWGGGIADVPGRYDVPVSRTKSNCEKWFHMQPLFIGCNQNPLH